MRPAQNVDLEKIIEAAEYAKQCSAAGDSLGAFAAADYIIRACRTEVPAKGGNHVQGSSTHQR